METDEGSDEPPIDLQQTIQRLEVSDPQIQAELARFDDQGHPDLRWGDYPWLLRKGSSRLYGVYVGGRLAARMWLIETANSEGLGRRAQLRLHFLEVLPPYRSLGLGTLLVRFAQGFGLPMAVDALPGAEDFYLRLGFAPVDGTGHKRNGWGERTFVWLPQRAPVGEPVLRGATAR
ncbi:GNAT family N-acetyltransferase [Limnochorda pilosa]|uniref:N-acetyltransferase domain-containing protein n=1 Tax=Limnochorda pilosa TaxID=1555112 RepID=A0A0K2SHB5_LIMPI|nr:GNAT family N-acetyltransferase [Limnochorda pilosa]BAS26199.1 hypothetical protein LIP_0342 [Limnochorda pilosa]